MNTGDMTRAQLQESKRYGRQKLICLLADRLVNLVFLGIMAVLLARPIDGWLGALPTSQSIRLILFFLILVCLNSCISLPLALLSGHILEHRYRLSNQSLGQWLLRHLKHLSLATVLGSIMFLGLYWIIWLTSAHWWWLVAAVGYFMVSVLFGQLAPVIILPLFYKVERSDDVELTAMVSRVARGTGLEIAGVYRMKLSDETGKANAILAGLGRTRRVIMGDTLLNRFTLDEISVILAHEVGHHVFGHIPKMLLAGIWYSVVGFWVCDELLAIYIGDGTFQYSSLPVYTLPLLMLVLTVYSMFLEPLRNFISRRNERQCDRYALKRTGLRDSYVSAFRKLAKLNKEDPYPHPIEVFFFHSHPPISDRLAIAEKR